MRRASVYAEFELDITLYSAQYLPDKAIIPSYFIQTPDLQRSVLDVAEFGAARKLPLLADVLDRLYEVSRADYFIYTNVDIALQPHFYLAVDAFVQAGYDSFVINRRTISAEYAAVSDLEKMFAERGTPHRGWDCFVFPRSYYPHFQLYNICIGASRVGLALLANLVAFSHQFREFDDAHLTFHIGDERSWRKPAYRGYGEHNTAELMRILAALEAQCGPFPPQSIPGSFLARKRRFGRLYEAWARTVYLPAGLSRLINRLSRRT